MVFLCIACTVLFNVYFGKFDDIYWYWWKWLHEHTKISLDSNCGKSGQTNFIFLHVGVVLYKPGQVFMPLAAIITTRHHGMLATSHCRHSTGISTHLSSRAWWRSPRFWIVFSMLIIAWLNSSQICYMGLQSGDLAGCSILLTLFVEGNQAQPEHGQVLLLTSW